MQNITAASKTQRRLFLLYVTKFILQQCYFSVRSVIIFQNEMLWRYNLKYFAVSRFSVSFLLAFNLQ